MAIISTKLESGPLLFAQLTYLFIISSCKEWSYTLLGMEIVVGNFWFLSSVRSILLWISGDVAAPVFF
jgi:hypothetical protein